MAELNKEIIHTIKDLDSDKNMKDFLEKILEYELDQYVNGSPDSNIASGNKYKGFIADYAKWGV